MKHKAIVVPVEDPPRLVEIEESVTEWHRLIHCDYLDFVTLRRLGIQLVVDDWGARDKEPNHQVMEMTRGMGYMGTLYGDVLVVGVDQIGELADVPEAVLELWGL